MFPGPNRINRTLPRFLKPIADRCNSRRTRCLAPALLESTVPWRTFSSGTGPIPSPRSMQRQAFANERSNAGRSLPDRQFSDPMDEDLRRLFDEPRGGRTKTGVQYQVTGLFDVPPFKSPEALLRHANRALRRANAIVSRVCSPTSDHAELQKVVRRLDRLSDEICSVVDAAEVIRNIHPNSEWVEAADEVHGHLSSYLNQLNTHQGLYEALKRANSIGTVRRTWSTVEQRVADLLLSDFEKSGIHMPADKRNRFVKLHDEILRVGHHFTLSSAPGVREIEVEDPWNALRGVRSDLVRTLIRRSAGREVAKVPTVGYPAQLIMRTARDGEVRKQLFGAMNSATKQQIELLEQMLRLRAELGRLLGKQSYGEIYLEDKMAKDPAHVMRFLTSLAVAHMPKARQEIAQLQKLKQLHGTGNSTTDPAIYGWDRQFFSQFLPQPPSEAVFPSMHMPLAHPTSLGDRPGVAGGISLGTTIAGLSRLLHILYGIRLVPADSSPGELWHEDVRRLNAVHDVEGRVGSIYCDLVTRPDGSRKYENAAHFTVQCSRRVDWDTEDPLGPMDGAAEEGEKVPGKEGQYKLPIVVLVTNFQPGNRLSWNEVETVFHEMGHAVHSMLARTDFQHVAGTRCQMDFVEVPSTLMEFLLRHVGIPGVAVPPFQRDSLDFQTQVRLAILDQAYHSEAVLAPGFDTTNIAAAIQSEYDVIPYMPGTAWQVQFGHLFSYGCGYYTYLWSRLWAGRIFRKLFAGKSEAAMREGGDRLRSEVLGWGGGRDGWQSLQGLGIIQEGEEGLGHIDLEELGL